MSDVVDVRFTIAPAPGSASKPVSAAGSVLVDDAQAVQTTRTRIAGVGPDHLRVFDLPYRDTSGCSTSRNAQPIAFDDLVFQ